MQSLYDYIVTTENRYNNKKSIGDKELILNTEVTERDYHFVNRIGIIESSPREEFLGLRDGENIIVHHNVFRRWYNMKGDEKDSRNFFEGNKFFVQPDQIFGYKRDGEWNAVDGYTFVEPFLEDSEWSNQEKPLQGIVRFGKLKGHLVGFKPNAEYEFNIDGTKLYRVLSNHITVDYGFKKENQTVD